MIPTTLVEKKDCLARQWPFSSLPPAILEAMAATTRHREYGPDDALVRQGERGETLLTIIAGTVEVNTSSNGRSRTLATLTDEGVLGEMALLTDEPRLATARAVTRVHALSITSAEFREIAKRYPILDATLTELLARRLGNAGHDGLCGKEFEGYRIERPLGKGGMGVVYEALEVSDEFPVALKMLSHCLVNDASARARFEKEADIIETFRHPNIVRSYGRFAAFRTYFTVMELCDGCDLMQVVERNGPLPPGQVRRIVGQLATALSHAHDAGIIHRDIKPANVMIDWDGTIRLMDFGIAKPVLDESIDSTRVVLGTPGYMSPEQLLGKPVDVRTDLYSFGVTVYELLTGRKPFGSVGEQCTALLPARKEIDPVPPRDLDDLLRKTITPDPADRTVDLASLTRWAGPVDPGLAGDTSPP